MCDDSLSSPTTELLQILCTAIARDGGGSLVTALKDYDDVSPKRLNSLLIQSIGKPKLLSLFSEAFPEIFHVDRSITPHWVVLLTQQYVQEIGSNACTCTRTDDHHQHAKKQQLIDKARYVLRKRQSKLARRQRADNYEDSHKVNTPWLLKECMWEAHFYLRAADRYRSALYQCPEEVQPVGTKPWNDLVLDDFEAVLHESQGIFVLKNGKVCLTRVASSSTAVTNEEQDYVVQLDETLTQLVDGDGATQVALALLLHRHETFRQLLGGRDLWILIQQHPKRFQDIQVYQEGTDIMLQSKKQERNNGRMKVDQVGLYSVANAKWGNAMANIMVKACQKVGYTNNVTAIDLTASVGGMTLGLAKTNFFDTVLAVEIDSKRAELCRENMKHHGVKVSVHTMDAMDVIQTLPRRSCLVLDPPWGGVNYKRRDDTEPFMMGAWTLEQVLEHVSVHLSPCLVGLRLPVTLVVEMFLENLRKRGLVFETNLIRKLNVQLFVVIFFREETYHKM
jgi:predicted RNA methylase